MDICVIDGIEYDVIVLEIEETFNILYSDQTGRTVGIGAPMVLDPLGTFIGHKVKIKCKKGHEAEYDSLFDFLTTPRYDGITVKMVHNQTSIEYEAYISNGARKVKIIDKDEEKVYWGEMTLNIVPIRAQVTP